MYRSLFRMAKLIHEVIVEAGKKRSKAEKVECLKQNESWALKDILRGTYDDAVQWLVPEGAPPYTPNKEESTPSNLIRQNTQFKYLVDSRDARNVLKAKRENIYIRLLESIHPLDAEIVINMVSKKSIKGISKSVVQEAYPGLIQKG
tara:strand:+ start:50 stop:490 length:441 start_codon:yes stop_codon:yes gene_type:complete